MKTRWLTLEEAWEVSAKYGFKIYHRSFVKEREWWWIAVKEQKLNFTTAEGIDINSYPSTSNYYRNGFYLHPKEVHDYFFNNRVKDLLSD